jgi:Type IV secretion-system coupling protein DNA-binding domain
MIMGDSGTGKSALLRQVLMQIAERGETAIVYDPALEYTPQFYQPSRGDLILNPLDARCPFWSPSAEVMHEAEALTLATSLFPDKPRENTFFVEGPMTATRKRTTRKQFLAEASVAEIDRR